VIGALLSRVRVYVLKPLEDDALVTLLRRALVDEERGLGKERLTIEDDAVKLLVGIADGDARRMLNLLEVASQLVETDRRIDVALIENASSQRLRRFDKGGDVFYEQISALHKAVRGSSPDAALYWLCRMLDGGCDPIYIARRVVRMASEDIGNADPRALSIAIDAWNAYERLGSPEGELAIAQAVVYLAVVPKSNAMLTAFGAAMGDVRSQPSYEVPLRLRNAPTRLLKSLGHGKEYRYAHDEPDAYAAGESYFPDELGERQYYHPSSRGLEQRIAERLARFKELDADKSSSLAQKRDAEGSSLAPKRDAEGSSLAPKRDAEGS
jgi:putative ATPase